MERDRGNGDGKETLRQRTSKGLMFHGIQRVWCKSAIKLSFHSTSPRTERWPCCWWSVSLRVCHCQYCHCGCQHSTSSLLCYYSLSFTFHAHTLRFAIQRTSPWTMQSNRGNIIFFFALPHLRAHLQVVANHNIMEPRRLQTSYLKIMIWKCVIFF